MGIKVVEKPEETIDTQANHWHRDLEKLTVNKLVKLVQNIIHSERKRISEKQVRQWIEKAVKEGAIDKSNLKPSLASNLTI